MLFCQLPSFLSPRFRVPACSSSLGTLSLPNTWMSFGDAVMTGSALPTLAIEIGERRLPIALRNAATAVIQHWADKTPNSITLTKYLSFSLVAFLKARFDSYNVAAGPFQLATRSHVLPYRFAAALMDGDNFYLVIALSEGELTKLPKIESDIRSIMNGHSEWMFKQEINSNAFQVRGKNNQLPSSEALVVIAVLGKVTTTPTMLKLPKSGARVLPLPDFISILDSVSDIEELDHYWSFADEYAGVVRGISSPVDRFAAFRDSHSILVEGAVSPHFISLDPHWGSRWRYQALRDYWSKAPPLFPVDAGITWTCKRDSEGLHQLKARNEPTLSWCAIAGGCVVHFVFPFRDQLLKVEDGRILELITHCLADSLALRSPLVSPHPIFQHRRIVTLCRANRAFLISDSPENAESAPLISDCSLTSEAGADTVRVTIHVNLVRVKQALNDPMDASFEVEALSTWIDCVSKLLDVPHEASLVSSLASTINRLPRFTVTTLQRLVDVPDYADPPCLAHSITRQPGKPWP